jgi:hypothetical protein
MKRTVPGEKTGRENKGTPGADSADKIAGTNPVKDII